MTSSIWRLKQIRPKAISQSLISGVVLAALCAVSPASAQTFRDMLRQIERAIENPGGEPSRRAPPPQRYGDPNASDWTATSTAASGVTGDISIQDNRIVFSNGASISISPVGPDRPEIYRVEPPANPLLANGNRLCGASTPTFVVLGRGENSADLAQSNSLHLKIYSGSEIPPASASVGPTPDGRGSCAVLNYERDVSSTSPRWNATWQAQKLLNALNYDAGAADGAMGPRTRSALSAFQNDQNLPVTGSANAETLAALNRRAADGQTSVARSMPAGGTGRVGDARSEGPAAVNSEPDEGDVDLSGYLLVNERGNPLPQYRQFDRRLALHGVAIAPETLAGGVAQRWFDFDHNASARPPSPLRQRFNTANAVDRQDIVKEFAAGIVNEARSQSIQSQRTYKVAIIFQLFTGVYADGRLAFSPSKQGLSAIGPRERTVHLQPRLFPIEYWAQLMDMPDIASIAVDAAREKDIRRSLAATGRPNMAVGVLRMTITIPAEGRVTKRNFLPPAIQASATLDGVSLHTHQFLNGQQVPGELLYKWKRESPAAARPKDIASFARDNGIPIIGGLPAILHGSTIGNFEDFARDRARYPKITEAWREALDLLTIGAVPSTLDSLASVVYWTDKRLSQAEQVQLLGPGKRAGMLDEFQQRKLAADFKDSFRDRIRASAPQFPFELVEIRQVTLGKYDFADESFPLSFEQARAIHLPQPSVGGPPVAPLNISGFPKKLKIPAREAEALTNSLKESGAGGRFTYLALYVRAKALNFAGGSPAQGAAISELIARRRVDVELREMKLFADVRLTRELANFDISDFRPVEPRRDPLSAQLDQITITSTERPIPLAFWPMQDAPKPTVPRIVEIGPDVIDLLILRQDPSRFESAMIARVFYDRWLYERSTESPAWGRFFTIASPPNRVEFERMLPAFKTWTKARIDALPKRLVVNWSHTDDSWNFDGCRGYLTAVRQKANYRNALDGLVDFSKSDPVFQARQKMMRAESPVEAGPLYFLLEGRPAADCGKRRLEGLAQKFDDESRATSLVVVENAIMPAGREFMNLGRSELEVELERLEIVADGTTPSVRLFGSAVASRHFAKDNSLVAALTKADLPKPETKPDRPPAASGPDILGVQLGMSFQEAEALIRKNLDVGRVMVASRDWQPDAAAGKPGTYTSGRLFVSADESDMIMLFDEPPAARGIVMGVLRQIAFPKGQVPAAAIVNQLRQKYGRETSTARAQLVWSESGAAGDDRCIPAENAAQSMNIWRDEKGQIDDKWRPKGMRYSGMSPSLRRDSSSGARCARLLTALVDIQSNAEWDRLEVRLFDSETYSTFHSMSKEMLKAAPAAGPTPANVPVIKF